MVKSTDATNKSQKKSRGRVPTPRGTMKGVQVAVRLSTEEVAKLDAWIAEQKERFGVEFSRAAAIRARLIQAPETALTAAESAEAAKPPRSRPAKK